MANRQTDTHLDWEWIDAQLTKLPPMSDRQARAISVLLFGVGALDEWGGPADV